MPACGYLYGLNLFNKKFINSTLRINDLNKNIKNDRVAIFPIRIEEQDPAQNNIFYICKNNNPTKVRKYDITHKINTFYN